ncbi:MAG: hypothetical protein ACLT38_11560 [Akkermansia sp.]
MGGGDIQFSPTQAMASPLMKPIFLYFMQDGQHGGFCLPSG